MLAILGVVLIILGAKGLTGEGIWLTSEKQLEGPIVKVIGALVIIGGVAVIGFAFVV